jgi:hypothetical protein
VEEIATKEQRLGKLELKRGCVKNIFPVGVEVSTCSDSETNTIPRGKVSSARTRWETERAKRSNSPRHDYVEKPSEPSNSVDGIF